jgi:hypothetical protein
MRYFTVIIYGSVFQGSSATRFNLFHYSQVETLRLKNECEVQFIYDSGVSCVIFFVKDAVIGIIIKNKKHLKGLKLP